MANIEGESLIFSDEAFDTYYPNPVMGSGNYAALKLVFKKPYIEKHPYEGKTPSKDGKHHSDLPIPFKYFTIFNG